MLDGFVRFVGKVNKNGIEYSELMKNTLKGVNDAGSIAAPAIVRQGEGRFVTPESKVDGLYTAGAYDCTIAVTVCRGARGDVIRVGMAHIDPMMPEKEVEKFFFLSAIGGTVEAYMFGGNYPLKEVDGKPRKDIDEIASGVKGVAVKFYSRDFGAGFFAEDDAAYVDKHGGLYYGHVPRLDNSEKIGKQDKKRYRSLVLSHQAPISIFYE